MSGAHRVSRGRVENNIMVDAYVCPMSRYVKYVHDCPLAFGDVVLSPWVIAPQHPMTRGHELLPPPRQNPRRQPRPHHDRIPRALQPHRHRHRLHQTLREDAPAPGHTKRRLTCPPLTSLPEPNAFAPQRSHPIGAHRSTPPPKPHFVRLGDQLKHYS